MKKGDQGKMANPKLRKKNDGEITHVIEISWSSIARILLTIAGLYIVYKILPVIVIFFFAFVLSSSLLPVVNFLQSKKIPKFIAIFATYIVMTILFVFLAVVVARPVINEISVVSDNMDEHIKQASVEINNLLRSIPLINAESFDLGEFFRVSVINRVLSSGITNLDATIVTISSVGNLISSFLIGVIISVYFLFDHDKAFDFLLVNIKDEHNKVLVKELIEEVETKLGNWLFNQGLLMIIIGTATYIMLRVLRVDFALPLAVMTGFFSLIPTFGPIFAAIITAVVTFVTSGLNIALATIVGSIIIQQLDNAFLTPRVMGNVSGLSPVLVLLGVMVGFGVGGVMGAIIAVPILVLAKVGLDFYSKLKELKIIGEL